MPKQAQHDGIWWKAIVPRSVTPAKAGVYLSGKTARSFADRVMDASLRWHDATGALRVTSGHHAPTDPLSYNAPTVRSEEHTSELQSLMRISYAVFCLKKKKIKRTTIIHPSISRSKHR